MEIYIIIFYLIGVVLTFGRLTGMAYYHEGIFRKYGQFEWIHKTPFHDGFIIFGALTSWIGFVLAILTYNRNIDDKFLFKWSYKDLNYE